MQGTAQTCGSGESQKTILSHPAPAETPKMTLSPNMLRLMNGTHPLSLVGPREISCTPIQNFMKNKIQVRLALLIAAACGLVGMSRDAFGQSTFTWNGGGTDGNWTTGANWGGTAPGSPQAILNFAGSTRLNNTNNFAAGSAGYRIFLSSGAGSFTLNGSGIKFFDFGGNDPKIENSSSTASTLNF